MKKITIKPVAHVTTKYRLKNSNYKTEKVIEPYDTIHKLLDGTKLYAEEDVRTMLEGIK